MTTTNHTKPAMTHTPEPWEQDTNDFFAVTADKDGLLVAETEIHDRTDEECYANARRIVAAVNACEGIATDALQQGVVSDLREALIDLLGDRPGVQDGICQHCGRDYMPDIVEGDCPSDDCPSFQARAVIAKATGGAA